MEMKQIHVRVRVLYVRSEKIDNSTDLTLNSREIAGTYPLIEKMKRGASNTFYDS
jgi:hypothetical protein